ncbi:MAG TPA: YkvA family protein [Steroidobacteraceae bacterium]|nr:YkvA family protein [Steroidobacteraceae bacterium]
MAYKLVIELSERDLLHFQREMRRAREAVRIAEDDEIIRAARDLLEDFVEVELPDFVSERVEKVRRLLDMLEDPDWALAESERAPVLAGLAYLCDPEDIIPDSLPGIGLLDDAVMIELVFRELHHEIDAYATFVEFRKRLSMADDGQRSRRLARRREQLMTRMRNRHRAEREAAARQGIPTSPLW